MIYNGWSDEVTTLEAGLLMSSPLHDKKNRGLYVGKALKTPCQHIDPEFRQLSTGKKHYLKLFGEKIILSKTYADIRGLDGMSFPELTLKYFNSKGITIQ